MVRKRADSSRMITYAHGVRPADNVWQTCPEIILPDKIGNCQFSPGIMRLVRARHADGRDEPRFLEMVRDSGPPETFPGLNNRCSGGI